MKSSFAMVQCILAVVFAAAVATATPHVAHGQTTMRGQPTTPFSTADFAKLRWLEGTWKATSPGETTRYERYHFLNDSTLDITYYADSLTGRQTGTARVNLSVGRVYLTLGPGRWGATRIDGGIYFVPQVNAHNTYNWEYKSNDDWTSTMRTGVGGRERVTVYQMERIRA